MPKNKGKGGKSKRKGKNKGTEGDKRDLLLKGEEQEYAQILKILGNCRVEAYCCDGKTRQCHVRGKFKKKVWINKDDIVLLGLREYQDAKADVIHKYTADEARTLIKKGHIPPDAKINVFEIAEDRNEEEEEDIDVGEQPSYGSISDSDLDDDDDEDDDEDDEKEEKKDHQQDFSSYKKPVNRNVPALDDL